MDHHDTLDQLDYQAKGDYDEKRSYSGMTNICRAERAEEMLRTYVSFTRQYDEPLERLISCALTDIMHLCRLNAVDFNLLLPVAKARHDKHAAGIFR